VGEKRRRTPLLSSNDQNTQYPTSNVLTGRAVSDEKIDAARKGKTEADRRRTPHSIKKRRKRRQSG